MLSYQVQITFRMLSLSVQLLSLVVQFSSVNSVQSLSRVQLFAGPWIAARQASLSITNSQRSFKLMSIESVTPSSHLILCRPLFLLLPVPPNIRVFSNESTLRMRWPKYWVSALASVLPKNIQGWSPSEWTGWISLQSKGLSRVFSNTTVQKYSDVIMENNCLTEEIENIFSCLFIDHAFTTKHHVLNGSGGSCSGIIAFYIKKKIRYYS